MGKRLRRFHPYILVDGAPGEEYPRINDMQTFELAVGQLTVVLRELNNAQPERIALFRALIVNNLPILDSELAGSAKHAVILSVFRSPTIKWKHFQTRDQRNKL